ncbi:hypothetical protein B0I72DRAFT_138657 [Yarrowia lipolytica]|uniref:Secreted protein n=1 Tax=Yarrowia lipolytica TaxID=4952 RepID=A0A371C7W6_YARLL|nr:hypothetical protein B0I71DRAFT_130900 [Yarrowia lipolytica]RDW32131.1 hypothetical protein B0I72DRAFT_138657 [Yarrowia lipolytica]
MVYLVVFGLVSPLPLSSGTSPACAMPITCPGAVTVLQLPSTVDPPTFQPKLSVERNSQVEHALIIKFTMADQMAQLVER